MAKPANIVLTYKDGKTAEGQSIVNMPNQDVLDLEDMLALALEHAYTVNQMTQAEIIRCSIIIDVDLPAFDGAITGCDLEEGAEFIFKEAGGFTSQVRIPAFYPSLFVAGTPEVNLAAGAVTDFTDHMLDDGLTTSRGEDLTALVSAKKSFQKSRV